MSATTQELENDITQMEDRLADVKVVVEVEREAWRRSSRTGKSGTKWKGARNKTLTLSTNNGSSDDIDEGITMMPGYWDALELAQYLNAKQLGGYAQVVVCEQITGKILLDTPAPKLRKLFEDVETSANDSSWESFQNEYMNLKKHQRRLEKAVATNRSQPDSARSVSSTFEASDHRPVPSSIMSSAGSALVFPLISPRVPGVPSSTNSSQAQQQNTAKSPTASKPTFPLRKPASSNNIPLATCWNCKTRFFRPHIKRPAARISNTELSSQPVSSTMRASLVVRAYCSQACQESIESSDIRISPSLSARVKVTFGSSNASIDEKSKQSRPSRVATGLASLSSSTSDHPDPDLICRSDSFTATRLESSTNANDSSNPPAKARHLRKSKSFARRPSRSDASLDDPNNFDFLHVAAPRREAASVVSTSSVVSTPPRQKYAEKHPIATATSGSYGGSRPVDVNASGTFTMCPSVTSLATNTYRAIAAPSNSHIRSPIGKPVPPALILNNSTSRGAAKQCKEYHQSKYKLDPGLFQAHQETFCSFFGAMPLNNRTHVLATGGARVVYGHGNLLRLQEFLTVRGLHRLSLTSRVWYDLITMSSAFSDALWGIHVLRIWRPTKEDEDFLHDIGVLKKPERPRRMLQILTRQVSRVMVENMKVLLNPETWQLATVMTPEEGEGVRLLHKVMGKKWVLHDEGELSPRRQSTAEMYEQTTAIYTRSGEIVAVCARQLIRPVDPMKLLIDILQGLKSGELCRVNCRRLRLFSQTNRLPFDKWALLPHCSRNVIEFFWSNTDSEQTAELLQLPVLPVWHQKILSKLQHALQQRLLGKDSVNFIIKVAHDQNAPAPALLSLEKFLTRCHTHNDTVATRSSTSTWSQQQRIQSAEQ